MTLFAGEFIFNGPPADPKTVRAMARALSPHDSPEPESSVSSDNRCALATLDQSTIAPQPSPQELSPDDQTVIFAFNGAIYNSRSLIKTTQGGGISTGASPEQQLLLDLHHRHGKAMLQHLRGAFAFAIYDSHTGTLLLARDHLGHTPLWYAPLPDRIIFASAPKALLQHPGVNPSLDEQALIAYCSIGYVPAPRSLWSGICKLPPGHYLLSRGDLVTPRPYWAPKPASLTGSPRDVVALVRETITGSVQEHLMSTTSPAALLSGGLDSSIVVALMSQLVGPSGTIKTFTAGFEQGDFDERLPARTVSTHCGTDHAELLIRPPSPNMLDELASLYDEPCGDSSALPTWVICAAAREHVNLAFLGDGGDEVFAGYDRHRALHLGATMGPATYTLVRLGAALVRPWAPLEERHRFRRLVRFADALPYPASLQYFTYRRLFAPSQLQRLFTDEFAEQVDLDAPQRWFCDLYEEGEFDDEVQRAQHHDLRTYLPDDLLVKTNAVAAATGLELRAPFLDIRLVELGLSLPVNLKIRRGRGKLVLREAFADLLPREVLMRPKRGFGVPLGGWLRNELRETLLETLLDAGLERRGIFRREAIEGLINDHLGRRNDHGHRLWAMLMLGRWMSRWG